MKKTILITMLTLLGMSQTVAQEYEYVPFVREGVKWVYYSINPFPSDGLDMHKEKQYYTFEIKGDTVYEGKHYKPVKLCYINDNGEEIAQNYTPIWLREENKVVYAIHLDGLCYTQCPVGIGWFVSELSGFPLTTSAEEFKLYNFNDPTAFYSSAENVGLVEHSGTDMMTIGGQNRKCHHYQTYYSDDDRIIEGVGYDGNAGFPLYYFYVFNTGFQVNYHLSHVIENDEIIYKSKWFEEPQPDEYEYVPFVREGVKWVYFYENYYSTLYGYDENLALGKNYLTLEIKGDTVIDGKTYKAMHKYSGSAIDWGHDTIPIYLREEDQVVYGIVPDCMLYHDCPIGYGPEYQLLDGLYGQIWNGQEFVLYDFSDTKSYYESDKMFDPDLFDEFEFSYIGSDMIRVGGAQVKRHACSRWNVEDYIIERIGFDGHNSGFTLHYFYSMTWADPRFHLSHVIENDEIIYKGIHYHPNIPGDVNGDGEVTIADANSVVDIVVMGGNSGHTRAPQADVNGDDEINIADINAIIDLIIKND